MRAAFASPRLQNEEMVSKAMVEMERDQILVVLLPRKTWDWI